MYVLGGDISEHTPIIHSWQTLLGYSWSVRHYGQQGSVDIIRFVFVVRSSFHFLKINSYQSRNQLVSKYLFLHSPQIVRQIHSELTNYRHVNCSQHWQPNVMAFFRKNLYRWLHLARPTIDILLFLYVPTLQPDRNCADSFREKCLI